MSKASDFDLSIRIGRLNLKNPVMVASGTFGYAEEFRDFFDLKQLGAIVTKTITLKPREGSPPPRIAETPSGILNSIGLHNKGLDNFIEEKLPYLEKIKTNIIVSIAAESPEELTQIVRRLDKTGIDGIELNLSCPNVTPSRDSSRGAKRKSRFLIAQRPSSTQKFVSVAREATGKTLITKLTPNVTDIVAIAKAASRAGSEAISLINTFYAMAIDIEMKKPKLGNIIGGLSGPAIKPIALRMVYDVVRAVDIPIVGMGGIMNAEDAVEFILAGASAVAVGTANLLNPRAVQEIISGLKDYMRRNKLKDIRRLVGALKI